MNRRHRIRRRPHRARFSAVGRSRARRRDQAQGRLEDQRHHRRLRRQFLQGEDQLRIRRSAEGSGRLHHGHGRREETGVRQREETGFGRSEEAGIRDREEIRVAAVKKSESAAAKTPVTAPAPAAAKPEKVEHASALRQRLRRRQRRRKPKLRNQILDHPQTIPSSSIRTWTLRLPRRRIPRSLRQLRRSSANISGSNCACETRRARADARRS